MTTFSQSGILSLVSLLGLLLGCDLQPVAFTRRADKATASGRNGEAFEGRLSAIKALLSSKEATNQVRGINSIERLAYDNKSRLQSEPEIIAQLETFCKSASNDVVVNALAALSTIESPRSLPVFKAGLASSDKWQHLFGARGVIAIPSSGKGNLETAVDKLVSIILDSREPNAEDERLVPDAIHFLEDLDEVAKLGFPHFADSIPEEIKAQRIGPKEWKTRPDIIAMRKKYRESVRKWWTEKRPEIISRILSANTDVRK